MTSNSASRGAGTKQRRLGQHRACGKCILLGEHFVVYGTPALALPVSAVGTDVRVEEAFGGKGWELISSADLTSEDEQRSREMLAAAVKGLALDPGASRRVTVESTIPLGHGLGSSAAFSVALVGALARSAGRQLPPTELRQRAHALEQLVHGTPSGIDDSVVTLERPVWFVKGETVQPLEPPELPRLVLASSGSPGCTGQAVALVRRLSETHPDHFAELCAQATAAAHRGKRALMTGDAEALGRLMDQVHSLLQEIGVSTAGLDRLVGAAREAGALGAKLTGSGMGGFAMALVEQATEDGVARALRGAGADLVLCGTRYD